MERFIISQEETIVVFDTCVMRKLCYELPNWVSFFETMSKQGYHFCISDVSMAEILNQIERDSISREQCKQCTDQLSRFISPLLPLLPGKKQLFNMSGLKDIEIPFDFDPEHAKIYSQAVWKYFASAYGINFSKDRIRYQYKNKAYEIQPHFEEAEPSLQKEREKWIQLIKQHNKYPKDQFSSHKNEIFQNIKKEMDQWAIGDPSLFIRADLLIKYLLETIDHSNQSENPYNPESRKKRNDGIDFLLNFSFILPAILCTCDDYFAKRLKNIDSYQSSWIYTPEELENAWKNRSIVKLEWPQSKDCC